MGKPKGQKVVFEQLRLICRSWSQGSMPVPTTAAAAPRCRVSRCPVDSCLSPWAPHPFFVDPRKCRASPKCRLAAIYRTNTYSKQKRRPEHRANLDPQLTESELGPPQRLARPRDPPAPRIRLVGGCGA